jgi:hypothetical protein
VVEWVAPDGCPDAAHVQHEVVRLLADARVPDGVYLRAHAEVRREKSGVWRVDLRTLGPEGPGLRRVTAESCPALAAATALILALALPIDSRRGPTNRAADASNPAPSKPAAPDVAAAMAAPSRSMAPDVAAATTVPSLVPVGVTRRWPSPRPMGFAVAASAVLDTGTLPTAAPGVAATLALIPGGFPGLRFELGAALFLTERITNPPTRSGTFSLRTGDAGGCLVPTSGPLEVGVCANVEMAWLSAAGLYESVRSHGDAEWIVLRARATVAYRGSNAWAIRADLGGGLDMTRPQFVSGGAQQGVIAQPARFTARGALGVELRF